MGDDPRSCSRTQQMKLENCQSRRVPCTLHHLLRSERHFCEVRKVVVPLPPSIGLIGANARIWSDGAELLRHKSSSRRATHEDAPSSPYVPDQKSRHPLAPITSLPSRLGSWQRCVLKKTAWAPLTCLQTTTGEPRPSAPSTTSRSAATPSCGDAT